MSRLKKELLRSLTDEERTQLERFARSPSQSAVSVARAKSLLAVAEGKNYTQAAQAAGRKSGDAVSHLVTRFNQEGIASLHQRHGGGPSLRYQVTERETILAEARRAPDRELDGTATWSLSTLQRALRKKGLTQISTYTIWHVLKEAGLGWQTSRAWCETGTSWRVRRRKSGNLVEMVVDPDAEAKKKLIESAYREAERQGLAVWCEDEAGPYQAIAQSGQSWEPLGHPVLHPHDYIRGGTAKMLTLLHPASGQVRVKGVISSTNVILHSWLKEQLQEMVAALPTRVIPSNTGEKERDREEWERWREGLSVRFTLLSELPPLRGLLILDNLAGHKTPEFVCCAKSLRDLRVLMEHGIMPLYTPLSGSWLNMAESIQRILVRRGLSGQEPESPEQIMDWLEATARGWNASPTAFSWGGKRATRRQRSRERRCGLGGSGAVASRPMRKIFRERFSTYGYGRAK